VRIAVRLDAEEVKKTLAGMLEKMANRAPAMRIIAEIVRTSVSKNFERGGRPLSWKPSRRAEREGGQTLVKTGRLVNSIFPRSDATKAQVGTNVVYAAIHQFGGKIGARVLTPVNKKALFWPGAKHPVKKVKSPSARGRGLKYYSNLHMKESSIVAPRAGGVELLHFRVKEAGLFPRLFYSIKRPACCEPA
jgi:phage virion morphogenesis protein